jgi:hypothetical protein
MDAGSRIRPEQLGRDRHPTGAMDAGSRIRRERVREKRARRQQVEETTIRRERVKSKRVRGWGVVGHLTFAGCSLECQDSRPDATHLPAAS